MSNRRIPCNLIRQNCYLRDIVDPLDFSSKYPEKVFTSLDEVPSDDGIKFVPNDYPYPITPESVNSYVDSSDYRKDPANAISSGVHGVNIGDCTDIQSILRMDSSAQRSLYEQLSAKFSSVESKSTQDPPEVKDNV